MISKMNVLIILALAAMTAAVPAKRDKRNFPYYGTNVPVYQTVQSNSQRSSTYESNSQESTSLQVQPYQNYEQYQPAVQPIYNVQQPYGEVQQVYRPQVYAYPVRQQSVYPAQVQTYNPVRAYASAQVYTPVQTYSYNPVRTYAPVQAYAKTYTPVQTYVTPANYRYNYGNTWKADPWC